MNDLVAETPGDLIGHSLFSLIDLAPRQVRVVGHADRSGPEPYNLGLSHRRAENVVKRMIRGGVPAIAVVIGAYGETKPAVATEDGIRKPANRRAEVSF